MIELKTYTNTDEGEPQAAFDALTPEQKTCVYMREERHGRYIYRYVTLRQDDPDYVNLEDLN